MATYKEEAVKAALVEMGYPPERFEDDGIVKRAIRRNIDAAEPYIREAARKEMEDRLARVQRFENIPIHGEYPGETMLRLGEVEDALATLASEDTTEGGDALGRMCRKCRGQGKPAVGCPRCRGLGLEPSEGSGAPLPEAEKCAEAVKVLTRFMCCKAGEQYVEEKLLRPFGFALDAGPVVSQNNRLREDAAYVEVLLREMVENLDQGDDDLADFRRRIFGTAQYLKSKLAELEPLPEGEKCKRCGGYGKARALDGELQSSNYVCPKCHGTGKKPLPETCEHDWFIPTSIGVPATSGVRLEVCRRCEATRAISTERTAR